MGVQLSRVQRSGGPEKWARDGGWLEVVDGKESRRGMGYYCGVMHLESDGQDTSKMRRGPVSPDQGYRGLTQGVEASWGRGLGDQLFHRHIWSTFSPDCAFNLWYSAIVKPFNISTQKKRRFGKRAEIPPSFPPLFSRVLLCLRYQEMIVASR